eukprot:TRINITY_DN18049_c0_g1_i1.p1 TRINITY_DN18049_c0_g1~~TRINITY_DN18049_c0_g1_i1.p1  ORF type:complete len:356 (+),score=35.21 TRINITY_DN18049_c0_g1_i1:85-1152(+)
MFIYDGANCKSNCQNLYIGNIAACAADPSCSVSGGKCVEPCELLNNTACADHPLCTMQNGQCTQGCGTRYTDALSCTSDSTCMWNALNSNCLERCEISHPTAPCPTGCVTTSAGTCATPCSASHNTRSGCDSDSNCLWNVVTGTCGAGCGSAELASCPSPCIATANSCLPPCSIRYATTTACAIDSKCQWNYKSASCQKKNCTGTATGCPSQCYIAGNDCLPACGDFPITGVCKTNSYCSWITPTSTCARKCSTYTAAQCTVSTCFPVESTCLDQCNTVTTALGCSALSLGCMWDGGSSQCVKKCEYKYTQASECASDPMCSVVGNGCVTKTCTCLLYTSPSPRDRTRSRMPSSA